MLRGFENPQQTIFIRGSCVSAIVLISSCSENWLFLPELNTHISYYRRLYRNKQLVVAF